MKVKREDKRAAALQLKAIIDIVKKVRWASSGDFSSFLRGHIISYN